MIRFTAERRDRSFTDKHGVVVHYYQWKAGKPKGIVQIAHGLGEHALRYEQLAQDLVAAGYTVYADDHRGHGETGFLQHGGDLTRMGRLGPGGLSAAIADVYQLTGIIREENPGVPLALLGHSWGSFIGQIIINDHADSYDAAILTGTAYRTLKYMKGGNFNADYRHLGDTGYEWLSRDTTVSKKFNEDPLSFPAEAVKLFGIIDSLKMLGKPARRLASDLPILIQIGSDDPVGGVESASLLAEAYRNRSGLSDVELIVYAEARHEVFNETNRDEVVTDTITWLDGRLHVGPDPRPDTPPAPAP